MTGLIVVLIVAALVWLRCWAVRIGRQLAADRRRDDDRD